MPNSSRSEERFPLLLFFLENGQKSKNKPTLIDKARYEGLTAGATAVITQWPGNKIVLNFLIIAILFRTINDELVSGYAYWSKSYIIFYTDVGFSDASKNERINCKMQK